MSLIFATLALMAKPNVESMIARSWSETLVVGHRGAAAYRPENTLESFEEAIRSGASATECDIHVSRDGELMIIHDSTLDRTTTLKGAVKDTDAQIMVTAGVPTLADYLRVTRDRIVSVLEIKDGAEVVKKVVNTVRDQKMTDQAIIFSFNADYVRQAEELDPRLYTVWLQSAPQSLDDHFAKLKELKADAIGVQYRSATPELVQAAHQRTIPVFVWTVPPGDEVKRLKNLKVNFIITDHPKDVLAELKPEEVTRNARA